MKLAGVLMSLLLVLGYTDGVVSYAQEGQGEIKAMDVELLEIDADGRVLTVAESASSDGAAREEISLDVPADALILLDGEEIELYDLITGDSLTVEHYVDRAGKIVVTKVHLNFDMLEIEEDEFVYE